MPQDIRNPVGFSRVPNAILDRFNDDDRREAFVGDQVRVRIALLIRAIREQRGWSQAELGREMGKPQPNISRLEDPDKGMPSVQTLLEAAAAFKLPLYIDMPNWEDWFRLISEASSNSLQRREFNADRLKSLAAAEGLDGDSAIKGPSAITALQPAKQEQGTPDQYITSKPGLSGQSTILPLSALKALNVDVWFDATTQKPSQNVASGRRETATGSIHENR